jgi:glycosyltransferase involved in cell wall biosynthesis
MRHQLRHHVGISSDQLVIGFAGKFIEKKNPDLVFQALEHLPPELKSNLHLMFVGSGQLQPKLGQYAEIARGKWGVPSTFTGFVNQSRLAPYYLAMDILLLPSRRMGEAWGLVVNEALNAGCAVVISEAVGCYKEFGDLERVRVIAVESDRQLAMAIEELARFPRDFRWAETHMQVYWSRAAAEGIRDGLAPYLQRHSRPYPDVKEHPT